MSKGWRGYVFSREIGGSIIPHRVQNLVIRDAARRRELHYLLSAVEYAMPGCFMMLDALIEERDQVDGLIFYATHLLPDERLHRDKLYQAFLEEEKGIYFALEDLMMQSHEDILFIEDILLCRTIDARERGTIEKVGAWLE
jgi:sporadic carbohydrate cluster protein (TIGR04323 family)